MTGTKLFGIRLLCHQREPCTLLGWVSCDTDDPRMCLLQLISKYSPSPCLCLRQLGPLSVSILGCANHHPCLPYTSSAIMSTRGQHGIGFTEKLGAPLGGKRPPVCSYFPIFKMVMISAPKGSLGGSPHLAHWFVSPRPQPCQIQRRSYGPKSGPPMRNLSASLFLCPPAQRNSPAAVGLCPPSQEPPLAPRAREFLSTSPTSAFPVIPAFLGSHMKASHSCDVALLPAEPQDK